MSEQRFLRSTSATRDKSTTSQSPSVPAAFSVLSDNAALQQSLAHQRRLSPGDILQLQRLIGNRAVGQLLSRQRDTTADSKPAAAPPEKSRIIIRRLNISRSKTGLDRKLLQLARYLRGIKSQDDFNKDMNYLSKQSQLRTGTIPPEINNWLEGSGWTSSTRYNEGQKQYYSPVGLVLNTSDLKKVLGNYGGDGNTSTLGPSDFDPSLTKAVWYQTYEAVRVELNRLNRVMWQTVAQNVRTKAIQSQGDADLLKPHLENILKNAQEDEKTQTIKVLQDAAIEHLGQFYKEAPNKNPRNLTETAQNERVFGPGINVEKLSLAEKAIREAENQIVKVHGTTTEIKYTESVLNAVLQDVEGTYYHKQAGSYPKEIDITLRHEDKQEPPAQPVPNPDWLAKRTTFASSTMNTEVSDKKQATVKKFALDDGVLKEE